MLAEIFDEERFMKSKLVMGLALVAGLVAVCTSVLAHHGGAAYDLTHVVVLNNVKVTQVLFANPHIVTFFDVTDKDGKVTHWAVEGNSPETVASQGWKSGTLQPGDVITVRIFQAKDGKPVGRMGEFTLPNGKVLSSYGGIAHPADEGKPVDCDKKTVAGNYGALACIDKGNTKNSK